MSLKSQSGADKVHEVPNAIVRAVPIVSEHKNILDVALVLDAVTVPLLDIVWFA